MEWGSGGGGDTSQPGREQKHQSGKLKGCQKEPQEAR